MAEASRYQLVRTIASGGMAQVYEAKAVGHDGFERRVAIKRVLPEHAHDASIRRMFFDEARIASRLHHGSIVQVLDYGLLDGAEFMVLEFVDGPDAWRAIKAAHEEDRPLDAALALHIVSEVAYALEYAHHREGDDGRPMLIVHRDVSPQNVLLSWDGDVKLSDFGIAFASDRREQTATGLVKGKAAYMAPEQASGQDVSGATDVYALGATLLRMLTGDPPTDVIDRITADAPLTLPPELEPDVAELIEACLALAPAERPTAAAVAHRAGQLAARGLDRDGRGALREWLAPLRDRFSRRSALDDVMGMFLVASGDGREYTVSRIEPAAQEPAAREPSAQEPSAVTRAATPTRGVDPAPPPNRTWIWGLAGVAAIGGAAAVMGVYAPSDVSEAVADAGVVAEDAGAPTSAPPSSDAGVDAAIPPPDAGSDAGPRRDVARAPRRRRDAGAPSPREPAPDAFGYLAVPRDPAGRWTSVRIDGARPRPLPLLPRRVHVGAHTLEFLDGDGATARRERVELTEQHTLGAPLRVR